jgi:hypothetical protein
MHSHNAQDSKTQTLRGIFDQRGILTSSDSIITIVEAR